MTATGSYTTYSWPFGYPNGDQPGYIRPDASGALVFATHSDSSIGRMTISGAVSFTPVTSGYPAAGLAVAANGAIWFTEPLGNAVGMLPPGPGQFPPTVPAPRRTGAAAGPRSPPGPQAYQGAGVNTATGAYSDARHRRAAAGPGRGVRASPSAYTSLDTASRAAGPGAGPTPTRPA